MSIQILFRKIVTLSLVRRIAFFMAIISLIVGLPFQASAQYHVSGVVEFAYRDYQTKTNGVVTSDEQYWTQVYRAATSGHFLDPRFMKFTAGAGYSVMTFKESPDRDVLDYNLSFQFFPGMKISWTLFGSESSQTVDSTSSIAGYDLQTRTYGGTLFIRPGSSANGRNNRNNRNNQNGGAFPDITLSRTHTESESKSLSSPLDESRDDTRASLSYRLNSAVDLNLDAGLEEYENFITSSFYATRTANLRSNIRVSPDGTLTLTGRLTDRETDNIAGINTSSDRTYASSALLDFKEKDGIKHSYRYDFARQLMEGTTNTDLRVHKGDARVIYNLRESLRVQGGVEYSLTDYTREPELPPGPGTDPGEISTLQTGGVTAGLLYKDKFSPRFFAPFVLDAGYDISAGSSSLSTETAGLSEGNGWYYSNTVNAGFSSDGWEKESLNLTYMFSTKRDHSPVNNDLWRHYYRAFFSSRRIPDTSVRGSASYTSQEDTSEARNYIIATEPGTNQQRRTVMYDVNADHTLSAYSTISAGASRGQTTSTYYSLSGLLPSSASLTDDKLVYGALYFTYPLTRMLLYRAQVREEMRNTTTEDIRSHQVNMNLDYRIRSIFVSFEYRWRQDIPEIGNKTEQQYFFAKISRPF